MKQNFNTRIKKGLFPEMPQSFADGLQRAAAAACGSQDTRTESTPATGSEPKQRRFPVGKVLAGAAAAVLVAACVVIAAFIPGIGRSSHGAAEPVVDPLLGKWALTEVEQNGETVDPEKIGLQMKLAFSDDGSVTVTTITGGAEGQYVYRYTLEDNAVTVTAEDASVTVLPEGGGTYDPETDTLRFVGADGDGALVFTREPDLVGKWTLTRIGELDPAALGVQYAEWMEFSADGTVTMIQLFNSDIEEETFAYTVYGKTVQIHTEGKETPEHMLLPEQLVYDRETDTLRCSKYKPGSGSQDELIFSRTPDAIVWHSLVGKWALTGIELYGSTGSPETSGLKMYLEFSDKESVTVTTVKETGTEQQTYQWHFISGNEIMLTEKDYITSSYYTILYDAATDTLRMDPDGYGLKGMMVFSRTPDAVIPELSVQKTAVGAWSHTVGVDYEQRITIRADGTATLKQTAGVTGPLDIQLTYTEQDGELRFMSVDTGTNDPLFSAVYDAERDVLAVTMNGETAEYERRIPDLAGSKWTLMDMKKISGNGIDAGGDLNEPELIGPEMYLEFDADGTVTVTVLYGDETVRRTFRSIANGTSVDIPDADETVIADTLEYDAATDTLRMYYVSYSGLQADMIFSRTPDAVIPTGNEPDLVGKWTLTGIELNGSVGSPDRLGLEMYLEFSGDGSLTLTCTMGGDFDIETFCYRVSENTVEALRAIDGTPADDTPDLTLTYNAATDTLRSEISSSTNSGALIFSRTPDAQIPEPERKEIAELRTQYPEYFGLDTSKGLKVYVWQMAENDYSCALISGTDERSEAEIGIQCKGTTIEQMRLIYSTYDAVKNDIDVEVVPFHNPISSYWYEIDKDYTDHVTWLSIGVSDAWIDDAEIYDVDGDGRLETCELWRGPTSGLYTAVLTVTRNGTVICQNTFNMAPWLWFVWKDGTLMIKWEPQDSGRETYYRITIENGMIVLTDESTGETVEYWGLDDPQWNMKQGS